MGKYFCSSKKRPHQCLACETMAGQVTFYCHIIMQCCKVPVFIHGSDWLAESISVVCHVTAGIQLDRSDFSPLPINILDVCMWVTFRWWLVTKRIYAVLRWSCYRYTSLFDQPWPCFISCAVHGVFVFMPWKCLLGDHTKLRHQPKLRKNL